MISTWEKWYPWYGVLAPAGKRYCMRRIRGRGCLRPAAGPAHPTRSAAAFRRWAPPLHFDWDVKSCAKEDGARQLSIAAPSARARTIASTALRRALRIRAERGRRRARPPPPPPSLSSPSLSSLFTSCVKSSDCAGHRGCAWRVRSQSGASGASGANTVNATPTGPVNTVKATPTARAAARSAPGGTAAAAAQERIEPLPGFKDTPAGERQNVFIRKLRLCSNVMVFSSGDGPHPEEVMRSLLVASVARASVAVDPTPHASH